MAPPRRHVSFTAGMFGKHPGKPVVLKALRAAGGTWTPTDVARWARSNGGSAKTYAALAHYVEQGKITYDPKVGWVYVPRYVPAESQVRTRT